MWMFNFFCGWLMVWCYIQFGNKLGWWFKSAYIVLGFLNFRFAYLGFFNM